MKARFIIRALGAAAVIAGLAPAAALAADIPCSTARLIVGGDLDEQGADALKKAFHGLSLGSLKTVAFDFARVTHVGSAGLGKLLLFYKKSATVGCDMRVENTPPGIRQLLSHRMRLGIAVLNVPT